MAEYIARKEANKWVADWLRADRNWHPYSKGKNIPTVEVFDILSRIPAEDVQPVKHAAWDYAMPVDGPERNRYRCSRCSGFALLDYWGNDVRSRYCPECGAIMDDLGKKYWVHYNGELTPAEG